MEESESSFFGMNLWGLSEKDETENIPNIDIEKFLQDNYNDVISLFTQTAYNELRRPFVVIFHEFNFKNAKLYIDKLYEVAQKFSNQIQFTVAKSFKDVSLFHFDSDELEDFGFGVDMEPYVFAVDANGRQHHFKDPFTIHDLMHNCDKLAKNEIYRSDPIPTETRKNEFVDVIVADNFRQLVEHNTKDVFVTLHSNFSFKHYFGLWGAAAELKADTNTLVFYGINTSTNYMPPEYRVSDLPTSFFIPRHDKTKRLRHIHTFHDDKETKLFIAQNASTELKTLDRKGRQRYAEAEPEQVELSFMISNLTEMLRQRLRSEDNDEHGFFRFLNSILSKVSKTERDNIKVELITLASNRVNEILKTNASTL